ncbi:ATP-binding protein [Peribacillus butanolivorans]|uniref:ATP-binding protein n=1 Tax=Peribacillus butanolivorans TaxID=421767 RepID=UPI0035DBB2D7
MKFFKKMKLRSKINWLVSLNILFVLILVISAFFYMFVSNKFSETGERALTVAKTVASLPQIVQAFHEQNPSSEIQPLVESVRLKTGAEFIVVGNMDTIRYSHPNSARIGEYMVGEDNEIVLKGKESITNAKGTLGYSVRGKAPIYDQNHQQIGIVSVGFLDKNIWSQLHLFLLKLIGIGALALLFGLSGAYILSGHIKKQIFNLEPYEIAFEMEKQSAIFEAIREGVIAVNSEGEVLTCNREAKKMLGMNDAEIIGTELSTILPMSSLPEVLNKGIPQNDQPMIVGNTLVISNWVPVIMSEKVIGAVSTFRDKLHLEKMDQHLDDIGRYVDTLRSQRHEYMNKLHLISGLIQMSEYDLAESVIKQVNEEHQSTLQSYLTKIRDPAIAGILVGKAHRAQELGIRLHIENESFVSESCPHREIVITVLGNIIENAFESIQLSSFKHESPAVTIFIKEEIDQLVINVLDNGPGVEPAIKDSLFKDGVTTKGKNRGFGLAFIFRLISNINGLITCDSSLKGTKMVVTLPVRRNFDE